MARTNRRAWRWAEIDELLDRFAAEYGTARSAEVCELLARVAQTPLDVDPGPSIPDSPVRYTEIPGARVEFIVTRTTEMNSLRLVAVMPRPW